MSRIAPLFSLALNKKASDLHLRAGVAPRLRVDGDIMTVPDFGAVNGEELISFHEQYRRGRPFNHDDFAVELEGCLWRVNASDNQTGPALIVRLVPPRIPSLEEIGLPPAFIEKIHQLRGVHLITGTTGSGKTTTLAAVVRHLSQLPIKIITLEDPIEQKHPQNANADIQQRELGQHFQNYPDAIRSALRQDPDVLLVGEMRDQATIRSVLTAAETGHMVISTMHNETAKDAVTRILDSCPSDAQAEHRGLVAKQLVTCVAQQLVKQQSGGRTAACELLVVTQAVASLIRDGKLDRLQDEIVRGGKDGMVSLTAALGQRFRSGHLSRERARDAAPDPKHFDVLFPLSP
jgi:twitching motility protein PilT